MLDPGAAPEKKAKKSRENHSTNNTLILMACMVIAFFLWLFVKLSNNYPGQVTAHIIYSNLPEDRVLIKPLDKQVKLRVETTGVKLLMAEMGIEPVYLNIDFQELHNHRYVLTEDLRRKFAEVLPAEMRLYSISPDTLFFYFDEKSTRRLPVKLNTQLEFEPQFGLKGTVQLKPDSVDVSGPRTVLDTLMEWPTIPLKRKNVKASLNGAIALVKPDKNGLSVDPDKVNYTLAVEEYTEQSIDVQVHKINVPKNLQITTYPKQIKVTFQVALSNYEAVNEDGFEAIADFSKVNMGTEKQVDVQLVKSPPYVKNVTFAPPSVEYIIYKVTAMLTTGLTGGIGSGKTYVCRIFEGLGVPVYYADERAKWLMQNDAQLIASIKQAFGEGIYSGNELERAKLAAMVFNDKPALEKLNSLVHPAVFNDTIIWLQEHKEFPYTIREAALIFETGSDQLMDKVITVTAPLEIRIQRVIERDHVSRESVMARVANQMHEEEKVKRADYVIYNDNDQPLIAQIERVHDELLKLWAQRD